jgi:hypothetical protein
MPPRKRPLRRVGELLPAIAQRLGIEEELRYARAMTSWQRLVEEHVPAAGGGSRLLEIRPPLLVVSADDAMLGQELRLRSTELLDAFATAPGGQRLLELRVVVGAAQERG